MAIQKTYQYKIYNSSFTYLGMLDIKKVISDFAFNQTINSAGTQIEIELAQTAPSALTVNANVVVVVEFSKYYPNGTTVFQGYISKTKTNYGDTDSITLTCISNGQDLSQYLIEAGDSTYMSQLTQNASFQIGDQDSMGQSYTEVAQTFTVAANTLIGSVDVMISTQEATQLYVFVCQRAGSTPDFNNDPIVMTGHVAVASGLVQSVQHVSFNSPATLSTSNTYYLRVAWQSSGVSTCQIFASSSNPYAGGQLYTDVFSQPATWNPVVSQAAYDLYFNIYQHGGSVVATYTSRDTSFMLSDLMTSYNSRGGLMQVPGNPVTPLHNVPYVDNNIPGAFWAAAYALPFTPTVNETINIVQLMLGSSSGSSFVAVSLCRGNPSLDLVNVIGGTESYTFGGSNVKLASSNSRIISSTSPGITGFSFSTPQILVAGTQYYLLLEFGQGGFNNLLFKGGSTGETTPSPFSDMYYGLCTINNVSSGMATHAANPNAYVNLAYVNPVPSIIDAGYLNTGTITSYVFKVQTMLDAIQAIDSLSPSDWYWYGDPATNSLVWQEASATADIILIKGRHLNSLDIESTKESIVNVVYFTGGDDGSGTSHNVFVKKVAAVGSNRVGLAQLNDNRVSGTGGNTVGGQIAQSFLNQNANETYVTTIVVMDSTMDTTLLKLGKVVGFAGFGDFADNLTMLIVGISKTPDSVMLNLGTLPVRPTQAVAQIEADLTSVATLANPTTPS